MQQKEARKRINIQLAHIENDFRQKLKVKFRLFSLCLMDSRNL